MDSFSVEVSLLLSIRVISRGNVEIAGDLFGVVGIEVGWSRCRDQW